MASANVAIAIRGGAVGLEARLRGSSTLWASGELSSDGNSRNNAAQVAGLRRVLFLLGLSFLILSLLSLV